MAASGRPVSHALEIPPGFLSAELRDVLRVIDAVHGDGVLPRISITWAAALDGDGFYRFDEATGMPIRMLINALGKYRRLAVVHEIGHFLDHQGIAGPGHFAASRSHSMRPWRVAVRASHAYERLRLLRDATSMRSQLDDDPLVRDEAEYPRYLLAYSELWARSYAQFVVSRGDDHALGEELVARRASTPGIDYHVQWDDDDFAPIEDEIERLFRGFGWLA